MAFKASLSLLTMAFICMLADTESRVNEDKYFEANLDKLMKNNICLNSVFAGMFKEINVSSKQLELLNNRKLDVSSCNIGMMDFNLGPSKTVLETLHLMQSNIKKGNECVRNILESNVQ